FPRTQPRADRRAPADAERPGVLAMAKAEARSLWDPAIVGAAARAALEKLHPRTMAKNPVMFVVEVGSALTTLALVRDAVQPRPRIRDPDRVVAPAVGAVRELRGGDGRGAWQGAGGRAAAHADRNRRRTHSRRRQDDGDGPRAGSAKRRHDPREGRRVHRGGR